MLADLLLQRWVPGHEAEPQSVVDHGEAPAGKLGRADQRTGDVVAGLGGLPCAPALGGQRLADTVDLAALQHCDRLARNTDIAILRRGVAHIDEVLSTSVERLGDLPPEAMSRD